MTENPLPSAPPVPGVGTYTSRPVTITAMQWTGDNPYAVQAFVGMHVTTPLGGSHHIFTVQNGVDKAELYVAANDSWLPLDIGEWIIKDELGFYPCKDSVFQTKYRPAEPAISEGADVQRLYATTDAAVWTDEFCKLNPGMDWGTMVGWFANAIETAKSIESEKHCG